MRNRHQLQKYDFTTPQARRESWAKILQGDYYEQTDSKLRQPATETEPARFCCLGVACDIFHRVTGDGEWHDTEFSVHDETDGGVLPNEVARWFGFLYQRRPDTNPNVTAEDVRVAVEDFLDHEEDDPTVEIPASELNDDYCLNFSQIGRAFAARFSRED